MSRTSLEHRHASDHGALVEVIPRRGEVVEFDPQRHGLVVAALDGGQT